MWWVSPNGDDEQGSGTEEYPWLTISTGLAQAHTGDVVQLNSGTYGSNGDESCTWCTETPRWTQQRCEMYRSIPNVKSAAECVFKCRIDATCEYAAVRSTELMLPARRRPALTSFRLLFFTG